jgi:ERCC4-related helicase
MNTTKPSVQLIGKDGNAFAILGACQRAAKKAGWTQEQIKSVMDEMTGGDYNHLLATAMEHFDVD